MGRQRTTGRRGGYLLVLTLFSIAIVGVLAVGFARFSMNHAVATLDDERDLQSKWGAASCERCAFVNYRRLLSTPAWDDKSNSVVSVPIARTAFDVQLGNQFFSVRLDDESAKLNVNMVFESNGRTDLKDCVRKVAELGQLAFNPLVATDRREETTQQRFESLGELLCVNEPIGEATDQQLLPGCLRVASESITCWGHSLNFNLAEKEVVFQAAKAIAGTTNANKIVRQLGKIPIDQILEELSVDASKMKTIKHWFRMESSAQSVWVVNHNGIRTRYSLSVREQMTKTLVRYNSFQW